MEFYISCHERSLHGRTHVMVTIIFLCPSLFLPCFSSYFYLSLPHIYCSVKFVPLTLAYDLVCTLIQTEISFNYQTLTLFQNWDLNIINMLTSFWWILTLLFMNQKQIHHFQENTLILTNLLLFKQQHKF